MERQNFNSWWRVFYQGRIIIMIISQHEEDSLRRISANRDTDNEFVKRPHTRKEKKFVLSAGFRIYAYFLQSLLFACIVSI